MKKKEGKERIDTGRKGKQREGRERTRKKWINKKDMGKKGKKGKKIEKYQKIRKELERNGRM